MTKTKLLAIYFIIFGLAILGLLCCFFIPFESTVLLAIVSTICGGVIGHCLFNIPLIIIKY